MEREQMFRGLIEILKKEVQLYRSFIDLLQEEQKNLIHADLESIEEGIKKKETLHLQVKLQEESRTALVQKLCSDLKIEEKEMILSRIIEVSEEPFSAELSRCQRELRDLVSSVTQLSQMNTRLVGGSMEFLKGSISLITSLTGEPPLYRPDGCFSTENDTAKVVNQKA
jgi:flagellar biosynthesis/type III secretory pathway chaperone